MKDLTPRKSDLDPIEIASIDEIRALQIERLQWSAGHAYDNVSMYKDRFAACGVHPADIKELSDIAKLPFTHKADLRDHYPFGLFAVPQAEVVRIHASSGTTGKPTVVGYTAQDINNWADLVARSLRASGTRPGDIVHNAYGYGLFTGGLGAHYGIERLGCTVVPVSGGMTERQVTLITDFRPSRSWSRRPTCSIFWSNSPGPVSMRATARLMSEFLAPSPGPMRCGPKLNKRSTCTPLIFTDFLR